MKPGSINTAVAPMITVSESVDSSCEGLLRLGHIYDEYASGLFRYARALVGSSEDAEDAVQNVFVRLARSADRLGKIVDIRNYLLRATRNSAYGILRDRRRKGQVEENTIHQEENKEIDALHSKTEIIMSVFSSLPPEQREVLALKVFQELTFKEIAEVIGKPQNTVQSRYRYAIERLRAKLGEQ